MITQLQARPIPFMWWDEPATADGGYLANEFDQAIVTEKDQKIFINEAEDAGVKDEEGNILTDEDGYTLKPNE